MNADQENGDLHGFPQQSAEESNGHGSGERQAQSKEKRLQRNKRICSTKAVETRLIHTYEAKWEDIKWSVRVTALK